ncbi:YedE-related selenium metabolism membrane protein [Candidatus Fermentibacteria bacterium]|nr:YedE-related selenium metabolism membrane protein [Candidatus Fermentibacteria bacterium]
MDVHALAANSNALRRESVPQRLTRFFASRKGIILAGAVIGIVAPLLQKLGNPKNMGICVACFERDIAGGLGLHRAAVVQYLRPEIPGFVLGAMLAAYLFGEFRARAGSAPIVRLVLGAFAMIGALAFLGCPWRAALRLAGGDLNAILGLAGLAAGIALGVQFLKSGYTLGRAPKTYAAVGWIMPLLMVGLLLLRILAPTFCKDGPIFFSASGPGSLHAPLSIALIAGLLIGFLAQRTRFCTMGSIRDVILMRDTHLLSGFGTLILVAVIVNLIFGHARLGLAGQPVAHSNHLWNFLGMALSGLAFALAGGCPGRQLFLAGEGDGDAAVFVLGMIVGAGFSHNFALAGSPDSVAAGVAKVGGLTPFGQGAVLLGLVVCLLIGFTMREQRKEI